MNNYDSLVDCFVNSLKIKKSDVTPELEYNTISQWNSLAHMALVAEIENQFDIMLDTDEIIGMSSVAKAIEILTNHEIKF